MGQHVSVGKKFGRFVQNSIFAIYKEEPNERGKDLGVSGRRIGARLVGLFFELELQQGLLVLGVESDEE